MYGRVQSHSCWLRAPIQQCLIRNEHCKKREGEKERYRLLWEVRRCLGLSRLQSFHWQCQQYFSPNIQALLAQIYLFTWFMVDAYTNLSMHSRKIFQHLCTFVRLHGMFGGKKGATYILQWLFHTRNWCKNCFFLLIMTDISKKCTRVLVHILLLKTTKRNHLAFVHSLFQCCICSSFNYIGCIRTSIIIPTSFLRFMTVYKYKFQGKIIYNTPEKS